ncbi:MAG TPA: transposase, partial [Solirubrobacteraceae bacterium]|nr:transposase [Solirubrobacteraceae bacterium]
MTQRFVSCDREQVLLMPVSSREWLPENHLAWFVLAAVEELDLSAFYGAYRQDANGRPAHDPAMMVALLLYAYARGQRSSRVIERECVEDIAFRVIAANRRPDHCTIARFRQRHETAIGELFGGVLALCSQAGLVRVGVVANDGTKIHANASHHANLDYDQIAREILAEAAETDRLEDEQYGDARGDGLPPELSTEQGRRGWLREAKPRVRGQAEQPGSRTRTEGNEQPPAEEQLRRVRRAAGAGRARCRPARRARRRRTSCASGPCGRSARCWPSGRCRGCRAVAAPRSGCATPVVA